MIMKGKTLLKADRFILVHGAWVGGWCWERVESALRAFGHETLAVDLPGHGDHKANLSEQTLQSYVNYIVEALDRQTEPVILVGHSMGGAVISMAAEARPEKIKKLVYYSAFMMRTGQSVNGIDGTGIKPLDLYGASSDSKTVACGKTQFAERFAADCSVKDQEYIRSRIGYEAIEPLTAPVTVTDEAWGSVRRFYIASTDDGAADPAAVSKMLKASPCEAVFEIKADHFGMYSAPEDLSCVLHCISLIK